MSTVSMDTPGSTIVPLLTVWVLLGTVLYLFGQKGTAGYSIVPVLTVGGIPGYSIVHLLTVGVLLGTVVYRY